MSLISDSYVLFKREMLIFRANLRTNIMRSIIFPLVIILFFGSIGSLPKNVPIAVVNLANNPQSLSFISQLNGNQSLQITAVTSEGQALSKLQNGAVVAIVVILPTFPSSGSGSGSPGIQVYYSNTQQSEAQIAVETVTGIALKSGQHVQTSTYGQLSGSPSSQLSSQVSSSSLYGAASSYKTFLTSGIIPMVVIFTALFGGGMALISDRQTGNLKAFFITPINRSAVAISRIMSSMVQGLISAYLALAIGVLLGASVAMFLPLALLYITVVVAVEVAGFAGIAIMLSSRISKVDAFAIFSQAVSLPLWFISGGITPIQSLPPWLIPVSVVDPLTYANQILRDIMMQGSIPAAVLVSDMLLLVAFSVALAALAVVIFNKSTEDSA